MFKIAVLLCLLSLSRASSYEDNSTNVGVYVNHVSSCNLNHVSGNMLCINRDYESAIQYHDVKHVTFCPYQYCVIFKTNNKQITCTGYVYLKMSGSMNEYLNPLTPNITNENFTGDPNNDYIKIGTAFLGYNILVDRFEQSVQTDVNIPIRTVRCMDPYSTCIDYADGSEECFGAKGLEFHGFLESTVFGFFIPGTLAFAIYIIAGGLYKNCIRNPCFTIITIPSIVVVCCSLILFVASDFIVKVFPFIIASLFGIIGGFLSSKVVFAAIDVRERKSGVRVTNDGDESAGMLEKNNVNQSDSNFKIEDDDGELTEIELGTRKQN